MTDPNVVRHEVVEVLPHHVHVGLKRTVGFWPLMFVSLGSIIGSGWLLGALFAAQAAGPASLLAWVLAAAMLMALALVHAELGAAYPVAGGTTRFPYFAFGALAGFAAGWVGWLQAVVIAPIEVEASIAYVSSTNWAQDNFVMLNDNGTLNGLGLLVASIAMLIFLAINMVGVHFFANVNGFIVVLKTAVPLLTIISLPFLSFHLSNFHAGGGFMPHGVHGIFAALPLGVVFALQGFESAVQMAGEAKDPQRDVSRAVITAMCIGTAIYLLLEIVYIGALNPSDIAHNWNNPSGVGDFGPYYTIAVAAGAGWLSYILLTDAIVSPADTGLIYMATTARLSYAIGEDDSLPDELNKTNNRGIPIYSLLLAFAAGMLVFLPFPSWGKLVGIVTAATAIMYAFAPVSLAALQLRDPDRPRPYRMPMPKLLNPVGFVSANLIIYWSGFEASWKLLTLILVGRLLFEVNLHTSEYLHRADIDWHAANWIWPWLIGITALGVMGRYGAGSLAILPEWWDLAAVIAFSLVMFYYAVSHAMSLEHIEESIAVDEEQLRLSRESEANLPG
jgi:amino acid transporter